MPVRADVIVRLAVAESAFLGVGIDDHVEVDARGCVGVGVGVGSGAALSQTSGHAVRPRVVHVRAADCPSVGLRSVESLRLRLRLRPVGHNTAQTVGGANHAEIAKVAACSRLRPRVGAGGNCAEESDSRSCGILVHWRLLVLHQGDGRSFAASSSQSALFCLGQLPPGSRRNEHGVGASVGRKVTLCVC